ncbi:MAG: hypothetical protein PHY73_07520 [Candidatus Omnitrophica bacterium]|nr:hypothetical protein [Candidatus Omnitrophota bacterium]
MIANNLKKRYLLWCYKTTKEQLDWVDRKFTQLEVDRYVLKSLLKSKDLKSHPKVDEFISYIEAKEKRGLKEKFLDAKSKKLKPEYVYLKSRLFAIEKAIVHFCGAKALKEIDALYESEMTRRILEARDHS